MRNINIMGMKLRGYSAGEALNMAKGFLEGGVVHTLLYLSDSILLEAGRSEERKGWVESADMTVWCGSEQPADAVAGNRSREVGGREFLQGLLGILASNHLAVLAMADTKEGAERLKDELLKLQSGVTVVGAFALNDAGSSREDMINEINLIAPAVVIARIEFATQMHWLGDSRALLNTRIWLALPEEFCCVEKKEHLLTKMKNHMRTVFIKKQIDRYRK